MLGVSPSCFFYVTIAGCQLFYLILSYNMSQQCQWCLCMLLVVPWAVARLQSIQLNIQQLMNCASTVVSLSSVLRSVAPMSIPSSQKSTEYMSVHRLFHTSVVVFYRTTTAPCLIYIVCLPFYPPVFVDNLHGRQQLAPCLDIVSSPDHTSLIGRKVIWLLTFTFLGCQMLCNWLTSSCISNLISYVIQCMVVL